MVKPPYPFRVKPRLDFEDPAAVSVAFMDHLSVLNMGSIEGETMRQSVKQAMNLFLACFGINRTEAPLTNLLVQNDSDDLTLGKVFELFRKVFLLDHYQKKPRATHLLRLTHEEKALWKKLSHPANFDFPSRASELGRWVRDRIIADVLEKAGKESRAHTEFVYESSIIGFFLNSLPRPILRRALHKASTKKGHLFSKDSGTRVQAMMAVLQASGVLNIRPGEYDQDGKPIPKQKGGKVLKALEHLFPITSDERGRQNEAIRRQVEAIMAADAVLREDEIDGLARISPDDILVARRIAIELTQRFRSANRKPAYIMPGDVYDILFSQPQHRFAPDPILYAWIEKVRQELLLNKDKPEGAAKKTISLNKAWESVRHKVPALRNEKPLLKILTRIEDRSLPLYCIQDLVAEGEANRADAVETIKDWLYNARLSRPFWFQDTAHEKQPWRSTPVLRHMANSLGFTKPEYLVARPGRVSTVAPSETAMPLAPGEVFAAAPDRMNADTAAALEEPLSAPVTAVMPSDSDEEEPKTASHFRGNVQERATLMANALSLFGADGAAVQRSILEGSLGRHAFDNRGLPSLPHVWVMWAAWPWTREAGMRQMVDAFHTFWEVDEERAHRYEGTARQQFIWAAAAAMRSQGRLFVTHDAFLQDVSQNAGVTRKSMTADDVLRLFNSAALRGDEQKAGLTALDQKTGKAFLGWADAVGAPVSRFFLGGDAGARFIKRLRSAVATPH